MKFYLVAFGVIFCCLSLMNQHASGSKDCVERSKKISINITDCCEVPDFYDEKVFNETYDKIVASKKAKPFTSLLNCLVEQEVYKTLKFVDSNGAIDEAKLKASISDFVKNPAWVKVYTESIPKCVNVAKNMSSEVQKITKIAKETCDFTYDIFTGCIAVHGLQNCPESSWGKNKNATVLKECDSLKQFIKDCSSDIAAFEEFIEKQST